jgi:hypothetical protein
MNTDPRDRSEENGEPGALDRLLAEAAAAERSLRHPDPERFLANLRGKLAPAAARPRRTLAYAIAAVVPLALTLWLLFGAPTPGSRSSEEDLALIERLDLLEVLAELSEGEIETLDPEFIDLVRDLDILDEIPVEILGG